MHRMIFLFLSQGRYDTVLFWLLVGLFAAFGAIAQLLSEGWATNGNAQNLGHVMVAMFAAWLIGLLTQEYITDKQGAVLALSALAAWSGRHILSRYSRLLEQAMLLPPLPRVPHKDDSDDT